MTLPSQISTRDNYGLRPCIPPYVLGQIAQRAAVRTGSEKTTPPVLILLQELAASFRAFSKVFGHENNKKNSRHQVPLVTGTKLETKKGNTIL